MNAFDLIINDKEQVSLNNIFFDEANKQKFEQLIKEHQYIEELSQYGLPVNNKILLHGSSGCCKTMTAKAIAKGHKFTLVKSVPIKEVEEKQKRAEV